MLSVFSPSGRADAFGTKYGVTVQRDLGPKWLPRYVRVSPSLPQTSVLNCCFPSLPGQSRQRNGFVDRVKRNA